MRTPSRAIMEAVLGHVGSGTLTLGYPDDSTRTFNGACAGPSAAVEVREQRALRRVLAGGDIGLAEGYIAGEWETPDLSAFLELAALNVGREGACSPIPVPAAPLQMAAHALRPNTPIGALANVRRHYDLGNGFYRLWLDPSMTYSCACWDDPSFDLEAAQRHKWDRVLELLDPKPGEHLLEIGCGWGGFAAYAAREADCRVTGISLSSEQTAWAKGRIAEQGLDESVDVRIQDYRTVDEAFDGVVSIEMFEAVGERWWPAFFASVRRALKPGRRAAIQVITIRDDLFESYRRHPGFTQKHIFPGGMLPSPAAFREQAVRAGLAVGTARTFGACYARTLETWLARYEAVLPQVGALGFDERFKRMWRYYLAYCRAGFVSGINDVMQVPLDAPAR